MPAKKTPIQHAGVVRRFAARLRELRVSRGLTQLQLAERAQVTGNYIGRLESAGAAPGIDLLERIAEALGTTAADLLPSGPPPDPAHVLRGEARRLFDNLMKTADHDALRALVPVLARFTDSPAADKER